VHGDGGEDEPAHECRQPRQVGREAAEREQEPAREQPDVEGEADDPGLGCHRDRRGVRGGGLRLLPFEVSQLGVGVLEAADADACDRMVDRDPAPFANELAAASGGAVEAAAVTEDVVSDVRHGERSHGDHDRRHRGEHQPSPAPGEDHGQDHTGHERGEARLGVGEVEADPDRGDRHRGADQEPPVAFEEDDDQAGKDRDDQEAPVDRRVPEDRVDAVERRVGVADLDLRVPEDVVRLVLVEPDGSEHERQRGQLHEQGERPKPVPREPRQRDGKQAEREVEEEQVDGALAQVAGPENREPDPGGERGERPRGDAELPHARVTAPQLPGEQERGRGHDAVHRHEQVRLGRADGDVDPCGDARERHERQEPRPALEDGRACDGEHDAEHRGSGE